jgi:hypothetical protein
MQKAQCGSPTACSSQMPVWCPIGAYLRGSSPNSALRVIPCSFSKLYAPTIQAGTHPSAGRSRHGPLHLGPRNKNSVMRTAWRLARSNNTFLCRMPAQSHGQERGQEAAVTCQAGVV